MNQYHLNDSYAQGPNKGCLIITLLTFLFIFLLATTGIAQSNLQGSCVKNIDGDTFIFSYLALSENKYVEYEEKHIKIRLYNVDTYELQSKKQSKDETSLGFKAKLFSTKQLQGKVRVQLLYKDWYGRWVAKVYPEGSTVRLGELLKKACLTTGKYENKRLGRVNIDHYHKNY